MLELSLLLPANIAEIARACERISYFQYFHIEICVHGIDTDTRVRLFTRYAQDLRSVLVGSTKTLMLQ